MNGRIDMMAFDAKLKPAFEKFAQAYTTIILMVEEFIESHGFLIDRPESWSMVRDATSWSDLSESVEKYINRRRSILR